MPWIGGCNHQKLKTNLRLSMNRLKLLQKKKTEMALKSRKEIADYIAVSKEDRARIRVEHIIREDYMVEALEIVEMYCDLLLARFGLIEQMPELDEGLEEVVASVIWASSRLEADVPELKIIKDEFRKKYSKEFVDFCQSNDSEAKVNQKLVHKLGVEAPPKQLVEMYMGEIAKSYTVPFTPDPGVMSVDALTTDELLLDVPAAMPSGGMPVRPPAGMPVMQPQAPPPAGFIYTQPPVAMPPPQPQDKGQSVGANMGIPNLPSVPDSVPVGGATGKDNDVDFDDLTRRFEQLKKKK